MRIQYDEGCHSDHTQIQTIQIQGTAKTESALNIACHSLIHGIKNPIGFVIHEMIHLTIWLIMKRAQRKIYN